MSTINEDYILRQIERISELIAVALGFNARGKVEHASRTLDAGLDELFGDQTGLLERLDAKTAARLIGDPRKIKAYADLIRTRVLVGDDARTNALLVARYQALDDEVSRLSN